MANKLFSVSPPPPLYPNYRAVSTQASGRWKRGEGATLPCSFEASHPGSLRAGTPILA